MPEDFVLAEMLMFYKKKCKNDRKNYRALGLLNHAYKVLSMLLLMYILPFITPKLSEMQAGFRKGRGCRDNILILVMTVHHLLKSAEQGISKGVIAYIDFTAAFDTISHSFLLQSLRDYEVPQNSAGWYKLFTNQQQLKFGFKNQVDIEPTHAKSTCEEE